jgi:SAM-dependent methyltransferase
VPASEERIVPDETEPGIVALHLKRYEFAAPLCEEKRVLDAGCGVGYGSAFLGARAARVLGIDVSEEAIEYARRRYSAPNVEFEQMDGSALDLGDETFDVVCSFETIEHLPEPEAAIAEAARVLRPEGVYVVSTPHVERTTRSPANPFHLVELSRSDLERLLRRSFEDVEVYGQRRLQTRRHRVAQRLDVLGLRRCFSSLRRAAAILGTRPMAELTSADVVITKADLDRASELVAVCRRPVRR